ncbi:MAG: chemotaxis protein CheB [Gammaproteobacteria bacterium]|nr:chemotaxis protein CheB [Gammaproteobacteria bacterium]
MQETTKKLIVIGSSAGGLSALKGALSALPSDFPVPILVVQHMLATADDLFIQLLQKDCHLKVQFAKNGYLPEANNIYVAAPDYHLRLDSSGVMMLSQDDLVAFSRPSIDVLFKSACLQKNTQITAIVLSGSNSDGSLGAKAIKEKGGTVIVQSPESAHEPVMPQAVIDLFDVDEIIWRDQISSYLWDKFHRP